MVSNELAKHNRLHFINNQQQPLKREEKVTLSFPLYCQLLQVHHLTEAKTKCKLRKTERLLSNSNISFKKLNTFVESLNLLVMPLACGTDPNTQ